MKWYLSHRADQEARQLADRHYNRQKIGTAQFVPPGRCLVLKNPHAFWITSWPFAEYVKHAWAGAWVCSAFRRGVKKWGYTWELAGFRHVGETKGGLLAFQILEKDMPSASPWLDYWEGNE